MKARFAIGVCLLALLLTGCEALHFYSQSVVGHTKLMLAREPLHSAIDQVSAQERELLTAIPSILAFAANDIGLEASGSYTSFVALDRDYPVYTVVAAPEFSTEPYVWCYLFIGCASYRGYFSEQKAKTYAQGLAERGLEVHTQGAIAYSTLGWFNDPVLPSMLRHGEIGLVELLLHELTHQRVYLSGDTRFNEALASAVAELATELWIIQNRPTARAQYQTALTMRADFDALIKQHKEKLNELYAKELPIETKRLRKQELNRTLKFNYEELKQTHWLGDSRYDEWFLMPVNNARLASFSSYRSLVTEFKALFGACEQQFEALFARLEQQLKLNADEQYIVPDTCAM